MVRQQGSHHLAGISAGTPEAAEAAAFLLAASSRWPSFHNELRKLGQGCVLSA